MLLETLITSSFPSPPRFQFLYSATQKPVKARPPFCCSRTNGDVNGLYSVPSQMSLEAHDDSESAQPSSSKSESKQDDIWQLFKEAQQNISYLNKQRLMAIEKLSKTTREKQILLDRIEQLEAETHTYIGRGDRNKLSVCWELLLRIDSMVLTGLINTGEASTLRRLVKDYSISVADVFSVSLERQDSELLSELRYFSNRRKMNSYHIIHICTEMEPLICGRSLAPYVTGLSHALQRKGHMVEVILPKYATLNLNNIQGLREVEAESYSYFNGQLHGNKIWTGVVSGIGVTLIEPLYYSSFFNRERVYGYSDDFERFSYFSRASLDYILKSGKQPDVLHIHNWETAVVGLLFWDIFVNQGLEGTRILLTCQGFHSQCLEQPEKLALCGLDPVRLHRLDRVQDNNKTHLANILKGGIVYSNEVIILSSIHTKDRVIYNMSHGLESTLAVHRDKLLVAPCGLDKFTWDPSNDNFLPATYSAEDLKGKTVCKVALQQRLGLSDLASAVVVGVIFSELTDIDIENLKAAMQSAGGRGAQFIFMAFNQMVGTNQTLKSLLEEYKDEDVNFINRDDEALLHLVFAGSDIILCQSFHDSTLQVPLKALRYGAVPIALSSNDSVFGQFVDRDLGASNFSQFIRSAIGNLSLSQALDEFRKNPTKWKQMIRDSMAKDFSWDAECCEVHESAYAAIKNL